MPFLNSMAKKIPARMLRKLYYSPMGSKLVRIISRRVNAMSLNYAIKT
jgi:hypothetical protein